MRERGLKPIRSGATVLRLMSLPVRERGLKLKPGDVSVMGQTVAPRAGAWIETSNCKGCMDGRRSLPVRERGLKQHILSFILLYTRVAPRAGAWIETKKVEERIVAQLSLPVRERGLKR